MQRILITGASGAIGRSIARRLAASGASLYLHYQQGEKQAERLCRELAETYMAQDFSCVQANLAQPDGVARLFEQIELSVDGLVYACGKSDVGLIQEVTFQQLTEAIQLMLISPFQLVQKMIRPMITAKSGRIVFISSIWGLTGASTEVLYSMVKGGQNSLVKALAKEMAPSGITVNAVAPGAVQTPMLDRFSNEDLDLVREDIPMGRLGQPDEIAALVQFLISADASYISGQVISANGAWYC
ncbi:MAG: elongation factor P 5-aminopentanone reductase [Sporolactobacillus sp.]